MKYKFINPEQIFGAVLALIILGVGVFASFTVFANIPVTTPVGSNTRLGNSTLYDADNILTNTTVRWIVTEPFINNTAVCVIWAEGNPLNSIAYDEWHVVQTVGAVNGTFVINASGVYAYRIDAATLNVNHNTSIRIEYPLANQQTSTISNSTYSSVINVSRTSNQVFNIIGVVLIIAAILAIVGLVYSYIKPRM